MVYIFSHGLFRLPGLGLPWKLWRKLFLCHKSVPPIGRMMVSDRWTYILMCTLNHKCVVHCPPVSTFIFVRGQGKKRYNMHQSLWASNFSLWHKFITLLYFYVSTFIKVKFYEKGEIQKKFVDGNFNNFFLPQVGPFLSLDVRNTLVWPCNLYTKFIAKFVSNLSFYFMVLNSFGVIVYIIIIALHCDSIQEFLHYMKIFVIQKFMF